MSNRTVIVTGGAKGIGEAAVRQFANEGYSVAIFDVDQVVGQSLAEELGDSVIFCSCDVSDTVSVREAVASVLERFGSISYLVNNAGILGYGTLTETTDALWDRVMSVNLKGAFNCARECIPHMQSNGGEC